MDFHFIKLNVNCTHLTLTDPSSKSRFICFADLQNANKCVDFITSYRSKHGVWPSFDMSEKKRKVKSLFQAKPRTPNELRRYLDIETYDIETLDRMACRNNVSFYCVLTFETIANGASDTISMSGREMDGVATLDDYTRALDLNLKVN